MRIVLYQMEDRGSIEENIRAACEVLKIDADFICFPEYFTIPADYRLKGKTVEDAWREVTIPTMKALIEASKDFNGYVIAGSVVEKCGSDYYNTCFVLRKGEIVTKYRKMNPIDKEIAMGIKPGSDVVSVKTQFGRFGILICADCLSNVTVEKVASVNDIIFLPISLTNVHPKVEGHPVSEKIARIYDVIVVKVSRIVRGHGVKSAVVSPRGVIREASSCGEELIVVELSPAKSDNDENRIEAFKSR